MINEEKELTQAEQKQIMLDILSKTIAFLDNNGLRYSLAFGTLLGAVRHKGFIPWDDDIDIMMPLDDYKKFIELSKKGAVADDIFVSVPIENPGHIWQMVKVISKKTYLVEPILLKKYRECQEPFGGIYIDVFPVYGIPNDKADVDKFLKKMHDIFKRCKWSSWKVPKFKGFLGFVKRIVYNICFTPYRIIGLKHYIKKLIKFSEKYPFGTTERVAYDMGFIANARGTARTEHIVETIDAEFDGVVCKIPKNYDIILTSAYGDYMKLPPENERKVHVRKVRYR